MAHFEGLYIWYIHNLQKHTTATKESRRWKKMACGYLSTIAKLLIVTVFALIFFSSAGNIEYITLNFFFLPKHLLQLSLNLFFLWTIVSQPSVDDSLFLSIEYFFSLGSHFLYLVWNIGKDQYFFLNTLKLNNTNCQHSFD